MRHPREDLDGWARENTHVATAKSKGRPFADHLRQPNRELSNHNQSALLPTRGAPFWLMTSQSSRLAISLSLHAIYLVCKVHPTPASPWRTFLHPIIPRGKFLDYDSTSEPDAPLHVLSGPYSTALSASTVTQDLDWLHPDPLDAKIESTPRGVCSYPRCGCNAAWADPLAFHVLASSAPTGTPGQPRGSANQFRSHLLFFGSR